MANNPYITYKDQVEFNRMISNNELDNGRKYKIIDTDEIVMAINTSEFIVLYPNAIPVDLNIDSTGTGAGVLLFRMESTKHQIITIKSGNARFHPTPTGSTGASTTWEIGPGFNTSIYIKSNSGSSVINVPDADSIINLGSLALNAYFWAYIVNGPILHLDLSKFVNILTMTANGNVIVSENLPESLKELRIGGTGMTWSHVGPLPSKLTFVQFHTGAIIDWTYSGPLPAQLRDIKFSVPGIKWTYAGALPAATRILQIGSVDCDWTGSDVGSGDITSLSLTNYRKSKISNAEMEAFLNSMAYRTGALPQDVTINDFADWENPSQGVEDAKLLLEELKQVSNVYLGE